ncbi:MAG: DUF2997 domain-containing protein [Bdellovibrionaceae bacterium]|nr:DUF2997 domain-containing protein [Bdellovibrionales bacterium]MCB9255377.1 DUF2997 domain-containing protein [Pseudobdellovibrionaceae bacterium]
MVKKITFKIDKAGEVQVEVDGFSGASCEEFTEPFEAAIGAVLKKEYKDAYYAENNEEKSIETRE